MKENDFSAIVESLTSDNLSEVKHALVLAISLIHEMLTEKQTDRNIKDPEWLK